MIKFAVARSSVRQPSPASSRRAEERTDEGAGERTHGRAGGRTDGQADGRTNGRMDERTDERADERTGGRACHSLVLLVLTSSADCWNDGARGRSKDQLDDGGCETTNGMGECACGLNDGRAVGRGRERTNGVAWTARRTSARAGERMRGRIGKRPRGTDVITNTRAPKPFDLVWCV